MPKLLSEPLIKFHMEAVYLEYSNCNQNCRLAYFAKHKENTLSKMQTQKHTTGTYLCMVC